MAAAERRSTRRGVIVAALVVLVGGLLGYGSAQLLTTHTEVLALARNVPVGSTITDADLTTASMVKDSNLSPIAASDRSQIVGLVAQVGLVKGVPLTRAQVGPASGFTSGEQLVALPLRQGQFAARGLSGGAKVLIVATPGQNGSVASGGAPGSGSGGSGAAASSGIAATVVDVGGINQASQVTVVDVRVGASDGVRVAQLASTGNLALISLPAGR